VKVEKIPQLPGKAPFRERFEDEVGRRCGEHPGAASGRADRLGGEDSARPGAAVSRALGPAPPPGAGRSWQRLKPFDKLARLQDAVARCLLANLTRIKYFPLQAVVSG